MQRLERKARRLMDDHLLANIAIRITRNGIFTSAIPLQHNPQVEERRTRALRKFEGQDVSLKQIRDITDEAMKPIAHSEGKTFEDVLLNLEDELRKTSNIY